MAERTAARVQLRELDAAVEGAVGLAQTRHDLTLHRHGTGGDLIPMPWTLIGRLLLEELNAERALEAAKTIASEVEGSTGLALRPLATIADDYILIGFVERFGELDLPRSVGEAGAAGFV